MITWLDPNALPRFPQTSSALDEPNGLLAAGGALTVDWLIAAYSRGIFPWFSENEPILWWTPAPRAILLPEMFHLSRSLQKLIRQGQYKITRDRSFESVVRHCAETRADQAGTWIVETMIDAYVDMHQAGLAHSYECWDADDRLVGGLYGISLGQVFFGESMFSRVSNASKLCLNYLIESQEYKLIDCQMATQHLMSLGAIEVERDQFESMLKKFIKR
ncbi:MAG: leucyl/phenylalanyl-tRNA--protein transferase [Gammaproteobacteria bacterium]|jgi:leucyl/phenylalanyl-tRNA--protein transferase